MTDEVRPIPVHLSLREQVEARLSTLDANTATVTIERVDGTTRIAGMVKLEQGWSFMGWLEKGQEDTAVGFEVGKHWGGN